MRTIREMTSKTRKVYFYMKDSETCRRFYADAEREGLTFGGDRPTQKEITDLVALLPDGEICYVGWAGRMCFGCGGSEVVRIDYARYADGADAYLFTGKAT